MTDFEFAMVLRKALELQVNYISNKEVTDADKLLEDLGNGEKIVAGIKQTAYIINTLCMDMGGRYSRDVLRKVRDLFIEKVTLKHKYLPEIDLMMEFGVLNEGDTIVVKDGEKEGKILSNCNILVNNQEKSLYDWLKVDYGQSDVESYRVAVHKETGKNLAQIVEEFMGSFSYSIDSILEFIPDGAYGILMD